MKFNKTNFRQGLLKQNQIIDYYLKECIKCSQQELDTQTQLQFLGPLFNELQIILKDNNQAPRLKVKATKFLAYLTLLGSNVFFQRIEQNLFNIIKNLCQYDKNLPIAKRGQQIFKNHQLYIKGTTQQRQQIREYGNKYIRFCLQSIQFWADTVPKDSKNEKSIFKKTYQNYKKQGLTFPPKEQYIIYSQQDQDLLSKKLAKLISQIYKQQESGEFSQYEEESQSQYIKSSLKKNNISIRKKSVDISIDNLINNTQSNTKKQKSLVLQIRSNYRNDKKNDVATKNTKDDDKGNQIKKITELQKKISDQQLKIKQYQKQIQQKKKYTMLKNALANGLDVNQIKQTKNQVINLQNENKKLKQINLKLQGQNQSYKKTIQKLEEQIKRLNQSFSSNSNKIKTFTFDIEKTSKNDIILEKNIEPEHVIIKQESIKTSSIKQSLKSLPIIKSEQKIKQVPQKIKKLKQELKKVKKQNKELKIAILNQCVQSTQFYNQEIKNKLESKIKFEESIAEQLFEPYFSNLSNEQKIRFKKCLVKNKQLLSKSKYIQIGCITELIDFSKIKIVIFITNVSNHQIIHFQLNILHKEEIFIERQQKVTDILQPNYQEKITNLFCIKNQQFGPVIIHITYKVENKEHKHNFILPLSKCKLVIGKIYNNQIFENTLQKTIELQKQVVSALNRLKQYYKMIIQKQENRKKKYYLKFQYFKQEYLITFFQIHKYVRIILSSQNKNCEHAKNLLEQFAFIFSKII